jgi:methionyl-tRNA synthetase
LQEIEEENYFFRFSKYQKRLLDLYDSRPDFVLPASRLGEIRTFVAKDLEDFSISRLKSKMPWGVPVPDDPDHVMYVWFDALVNYISAIGWPDNIERFNSLWPGMQIAGKDNLRQQSAMWQAMLMSAGLPNSKQIWIEGFITSGGQKMSKSLGNVISPVDIVKKYGTDALRYYLVHHIPPFEDGDFTEEKFKEVYNANLANGLGNLVSRVLKMSESYLGEPKNQRIKEIKKELEYEKLKNEYDLCMERFELGRAADIVWGLIGELDKEIQETEPYKLIKTDPEKAKEIVAGLLDGVSKVATLLEPMLPGTARKIKKAIADNKMPSPLFVRK